VAELHSRIQHLRSHQWRIVLWTGLCKTLAAAVLLFLLYFLTDWLFDLPWPARVLTVLLAFGVLGLTAWRSIWVELRRIGDSDAMALKLEAHNPELRGRLISTLQLSRASTAGTYVASPQLLEALEAETLRMSAPLDFTSVVSRELLLRFGIAGVTVVAVQVVLMARFPDYFKALGARLVDPTAQFPTRTRVSETKVPDLVARGENIPIEILLDETSELPTGPGYAVFRSREHDERITVELLPTGPAVFSGVMKKALEDVEMVAHVGDVRTSPRPIRVAARPEIDTQSALSQIRLKMPAYTRTPPPPPERFGAISALIGSRAELAFVSTKPLRSATLVRADGAKFEFATSDPQALQWVLPDLPVEKSTSYHVLLRDRDDLANSVPPVEYPIDARPDQTPVLKLLRPSRDTTAVTNAKLSVTFNVRDDYGVRTVWLVYRTLVDSQPTAAEPQRIELGKPPENTPVTVPWDLAALNAKPGEEILFWLEADDECPFNNQPPAARAPGAPIPSSARSADVKITILTREEKALELQAEIERLYLQLQGARQNQEDIKARVRSLLDELLKVRPAN